jgi:hypothetical protein
MLVELLRTNRAALLQEWTESVFASYPPETARFLRRQSNPFDNPVAAATAEGLGAMLSYLLDDGHREQLIADVDQFVRIRSVQEFTPAQAMGFLYTLKRLVREMALRQADTVEMHHDLADFDSSVDAVTLVCFDKYVRCRDQLYELKASSFERRTRVLVERMNRLCGGEVPEAGWDGEGDGIYAALPTDNSSDKRGGDS